MTTFAVDRGERTGRTRGRWPGWTVLAWLVILGLEAYLVIWPAVQPRTRIALEHTAQEIQGRYLIGHAELDPAQKPALLAAADRHDQSDFARLASVPVVSELGGAEEARQRLAQLDADWANRPANDPSRMLAGSLTRLYHAPPEPLTPEERARLRAELGWFGDLALASAPGQEAERERVLAQAKRTALVAILAFPLALSVLGVGAVLLTVFLARTLRRARTGTLPGLETGISAGGVYAETFALWLLFFVGMSHASRLLPEAVPHLLATGLLTLASLVVLVWPWLRGVSWSRVRSDVGLLAGPRPGWNVLVGFGCYACALPLLLAGLALSVGLRTLGQRLFGSIGPFGPDESPSHPALDWLVKGDWAVRLQTLFIAAVVAPLVEEVFFRGVLYRHLRELTARVGRLGSVLLSALLVSFLFAVIHPQGVFGIPPLMALAFAFAIVREWRGSLIPSMVAHALNNSVVTLVILAAAG